MLIAAIDPGKRGALVLVDTESDWGWYEKLRYDERGFLLNRLDLKLKNVEKILIENIKGRGFFGATACFKMGYYAGQISLEAFRTNIPIELITPLTWTKFIHQSIVLKKGVKGSKMKSLAAYLKFFPHEPIPKSVGKNAYHDGLIDALLIATYYVLINEKTLPKWKFLNTVEPFKC